MPHYTLRRKWQCLRAHPRADRISFASIARHSGGLLPTIPLFVVSMSRTRQEPVIVSSFSDRDQQPNFHMPDLPGDPFGQDSELYPPVPDFPRYDYWDESNFDGDFDSQRYAPDLVIHDRYSELPANVNQMADQDDHVQEPVARRRTSYRERRMRMQSYATDVVYDDPSTIETPVRRAPTDRVTRTTLQAASIPADLVTGTRSVARRRNARRSHAGRGGNSGWGWSHIVMPSMRQMLEQAFPTLVMALSLLVGWLVIVRVPALEALWAPIVLAPSAAIYFAANKYVHPMWRRCALMNLAAVGVFYPLLIVRQSYLRVPYVEWGNGTLRMPMISTLTIVVLLCGIAIAAAWLSQDDPEYAGVLFLPAALLVPFFAGATEIVSLRTALIIAASVFFAASLLTVIASMLPGSYPMLVAPVALAIEFLILPLSESVPIFPLGAGMASKLLFFVVLATTVGLTVGMPSLAAWVRQVRDIVNTYDQPAPVSR